MNVKNRISSTDLFFVIVQTVIGVGILTLPYDTYETAGNDGWISILISGIALQLVIFLLWLLAKRFPNLTLFDFTKEIVGKFPGTMINLFYIFHFLISVSYIFIVFTHTVKSWILPETPAWVLFLIGAILLIYGSVSSMKQIVALFSFFFLFIIVLLGIFLFVYRDPTLDIRYLLPIGSTGGLSILKATKDTFISFTGFELFLVYFAFTKQSKQRGALRAAMLAGSFITIYFVYIVIMSTILFSPEELKMTLSPILYILSAATFQIISRLDLIFLAIWGPVVLMTIISYSFAAGMGISKLFRINHKVAVTLFGICLFIVSMIFYYQEIETFKTWLEPLFLIFGIGLPLLLLVLALFLKKGGTSADEK